MKKSLYKKSLVLGIIALFVGVALAPGITATIETSETQSPNIEQEVLNNELVEIRVQLGNSDHKVLLTPTQSLELENLIDNMKARLDATQTIEETSQIFDETVISLYEFGLLPDGISVDDAQKLVKGIIRFNHMYKLFGGLSSSNLGIFDNETNLFCLIAGETDKTTFIPNAERFSGIIPFEKVLLILYKFWEIFPVSFWNIAILGYIRPPAVFPSSGWIFTIGLNGINEWNGEFYGIIHNLLHECFGIRGFTGIRIQNNGNDVYYLGSALLVKITNYNP